MKKVIITPGLIELGEREYTCNFRLGAAAAKICDVVILVGQTRSKPLAEGVKSTDFNTDNLHIVSSFKEAMEVYSKIADNNTVVLLENDLPDNYLK
jgi:UDP-N-acetylmuramoyl-tripeptide--D-alanyl-D-alanine ligase